MGNFDHINGLVRRKTGKCEKVLDRHLACKLSVQEHRLICNLNGYLKDEKQKDTVKDQMCQLVQTQAVEDLIGHQKNSRTTQGHNRFKRPSPPP